VDWSAKVLGLPASRLLRDRATASVLTIGGDEFTRQDLAHVSCFNFIAAQHLSAVLKTFRVTSTGDAFHNLSPAQLAVPGLGAIALAVLGAAFELKGLGGAAPLEDWATQHRPDTQRRSFVTFAALKTKSRDMQAERAERRAKKSRTRARRDQAHRLRVDRYQRRQGSL
jgi:hypothetical protein